MIAVAACGRAYERGPLINVGLRRDWGHLMYAVLGLLTSTFLFWLRCVGWAARGTLDKANAWFWFVGVPLVAFVGNYLGLGHLFVPDDPEHFVIFMIVTVLATWAVFFLSRFIVAPGKLVSDKEAVIRTLSERLTPKFDVKLVAGGVRTVETQLRSSPQTKGPLSKWVQLTVACASGVALKDCEVKVISIQRKIEDHEYEDLLYEAVSCIWSQTQLVKVDIQPLVPHAANLFSLEDVIPPKLFLQFDHAKFELTDELQKPGTYRITTVSTANNTSPVQRSFIFTWDGSFKNVSIGFESGQ